MTLRCRAAGATHYSCYNLVLDASQYGSNKHTDGLLCQFVRMGADRSGYSKLSLMRLRGRSESCRAIVELRYIGRMTNALRRPAEVI